MKKSILFAVFLFLLGVSFPAYLYANLVTNPGFEMGDFTGWSPSTYPIVYSSVYYPEVVHGGTYGAYLESTLEQPGTTSNITQNVFLAGPGTYEFGGYVRFFTFDPVSNWDQGQISIGLGGNYATLGSSPGNTPGPFIPTGSGFVSNYLMAENWTYFSGIYNYTGTGGFALLNISIQNSYSAEISTIAVDDVFVNRVPEPATMLLLGLGLLGMAGVRRFKK